MKTYRSFMSIICVMIFRFSHQHSSRQDQLKEPLLMLGTFGSEAFALSWMELGGLRDRVRTVHQWRWYLAYWSLYRYF